MSQQTIKLREILHRLNDEHNTTGCIYRAESAILKLIKEMVPEEQKLSLDAYLDEEVAEVKSWNACRQTFLDRLEEMERV